MQWILLILIQSTLCGKKSVQLSLKSIGVGSSQILGGGAKRVTNSRWRAPTQEKGYDLGFNGGPGGIVPGNPKTFSQTEA